MFTLKKILMMWQSAGSLYWCKEKVFWNVTVLKPWICPSTLPKGCGEQWWIKHFKQTKHVGKALRCLFSFEPKSLGDEVWL